MVYANAPAAQTSSKNFSLEVYVSADMSISDNALGMPTTISVGVPYNGTIRCTNSAAVTLSATGATCSVSGLPAGISVGACTPASPATLAPGASMVCPVTGTPTANAGTSITVTTSASNDVNTSNDILMIPISRGPGGGTASLGLSVAASPSVIAAIGQSITYTYTVTNSGTASATSLIITDTRVSGITCTTTTLAVGASTTCRGSTISTSADIVGRGISSSATARATAGAATVNSSTVTTTVGLDVAAIQQATRSAIQGMLSQRANLITTGGPDTARAHARLGSGTLFGGGSDSAGSSGGAGAGFAGGSPGIGLQRPPATFDGLGSSLSGAGPRPAGLGSSIGMTALGVQGDSLGMGAGTAGRLAMLGSPGTSVLQGGSILGGQTGMPFGWQREYEAAPAHTQPLASAFRFNGSHDNGIGRLAFATSLSQFREAAEAADNAKLAGLSTSGFGLTGATPRTASRSGAIDVWVEGNSSYFVNDRIDGRRQGHASLLHAGVDTVVMPGLLIGVMGSWDWMGDTVNGGLARDGRGWMAGPYMSARLTRNLYFDARAAWGYSTNHVDPLGAYTDTFYTTRALASAKLTGDWSQGAFRFRPSAELIWFSETAKAYTNAIGISIDAQTFSIGRTMFGPEVSYRLELADKSVLEPFVALKGVWDFARTGETTAAGVPVGHDGLRGRVEAGASYRAPSGVIVRAGGAYDGIGSNGYHAIQGQARVVLPLQ